MSLVVVGSVALDNIKTPAGSRADLLGGSATYFSLAASLFDRIEIVAVAGSDFPQRHLAFLRMRRIGIDGLERAEGKTFRWSGEYNEDVNTAHTLATHLNVFARFAPKIPKRLRNARHLFLANIDPRLQLSVLEQVPRARLVGCDTMNYWISKEKRGVERVFRRADLILLNDGEARMLTGEHNLIKASKDVLRLGPAAVIIKKGEHGVIARTRRSCFVAPAFPIENVVDPTGAGDTFAGGVMGYLSTRKRIRENDLRRSIIYGCVLASFTVEGFGVSRLARVEKKDLRERIGTYLSHIRISRV